MDVSRPVDWSDRLANLVAAGCQIATVLMLAARLGFNLALWWQRFTRDLQWRYRRWQFECFYRTVWSVRRGIDS